jgi:hypothetical protein
VESETTVVAAHLGRTAILASEVAKAASNAGASGTCEAAVERPTPVAASTRFDWCWMPAVRVETLTIEDGKEVVTGTAFVDVVDHMYWTRSSRSWHAEQGFLEASNPPPTGELKAVPLEAEAENTCSGGCKVTSGGNYSLTVPRQPEGPATKKIDLAAPGSGTMLGHLQAVWSFVTPSGPAEPPVDSTSAPVRCDSLPRNTAPNGCVDPDIVPTYVLSSVALPDIARFDAKQIRAHTSWHVLQRTTDPARIKANRKSACRGFVPINGPGKPKDSCDEFPYASTLQGPGMTEHVPLPENTKQGGNLGNFYTSNRLITEDKFCIEISPPLPGLSLPSCPPSMVFS